MASHKFTENRMLKYWLKLIDSNIYMISNIYQEMLNKCYQISSLLVVVCKRRLIPLGFGYVLNYKEYAKNNEVKERSNDTFMVILKLYNKIISDIHV